MYLLSSAFIFSNIWLSFLAFPAASNICWANGEVVCLVGDEFVDLIFRPFLSYRFCEVREGEFRVNELVGDGDLNVSLPRAGRLLFVERPFQVFIFFELALFGGVGVTADATSFGAVGFLTDR